MDGTPLIRSSLLVRLRDYQDQTPLEVFYILAEV